LGNKLINKIFYWLINPVLLCMFFNSYIPRIPWLCLLLSILCSGLIYYRIHLKNNVLLIVNLVSLISFFYINLLLFLDTDVFKNIELINSFLQCIGWASYYEGMNLDYFFKVLFGLLLPIFWYFNFALIRYLFQKNETKR